MNPEVFDSAALDRSNKTSWSRFSNECDKLQAFLSSRDLSIDELGVLLNQLEPAAGAQITEIILSLRETLTFREQSREYFKNLNSDSLPVAPSRLRRLNRV
jgi:hypothetical protein